MSEADGVDGGAICKRGFTHLQFAEKPEAPEAERHLERQTPRDVTWVDNACDMSKSMFKLYNASSTGRIAA
uniref:Uncharacterized protein n=1 Tax=Vespula pensylvanica TaxID=30213 RepID=A0A834K2K8_VESPE|nr:hypothetical protein H0235_016044 [Vespula pensylvanica]